MKHTVEIPELFLLVIAIHGNMGDGELPDLMKIWARGECGRLGLSEKFRELQKECLDELRLRLRNTLGNDLMNDLENEIDKVTGIIGGVIGQNQSK